MLKNSTKNKKNIFKCSEKFPASINYIGKLFGSLSSGFVSETLGRRTAMILINIPHLLAFVLFYFSKSIWNVFVAVTLLGFGSGFLKAPSSCFVAEIRCVLNNSNYFWWFVLLTKQLSIHCLVYGTLNYTATYTGHRISRYLLKR